MFLCTLLVMGAMNFCFGQINIKTERITVKTYDTNGLLEQFQLMGREAVDFDIPAYIKNNDHLERLIINGTLGTKLSKTIIKFDSKNQENPNSEYICKDTQEKHTPLIGIWGTGRNDLQGVDIKEVIPHTAAAIAGINANESIIEFDGEALNSFCDLQAAVKASTIGNSVELKLKNGERQYSKYVKVGSRGITTVNYKYCDEEPIQLITASNPNSENGDFSLTSYPNPTSAISHVNFNSKSEEDIIFTVTDIAGSLIHKEVIIDFNGSLRLDYDLNNQNDGTYILSIQQGKDFYSNKVQLIK